MNTPLAMPQQLLTDIRQILDQSRHHLQRTVNAAMVQAYCVWDV